MSVPPLGGRVLTFERWLQAIMGWPRLRFCTGALNSVPKVVVLTNPGGAGRDADQWGRAGLMEGRGGSSSSSAKLKLVGALGRGKCGGAAAETGRRCEYARDLQRQFCLPTKRGVGHRVLAVSA